MEKLWHVQRLKDGTYGNWREFKENEEGIIFKGDEIIGWDYGTEDYSCKVYGHFNKKSEYVIDRVGYDKNKKEVKKLKILVLKNIKTGKYRKIEARTIFMPHVKIEKDMIGDWINSEEFIVKIIEREVNKMKYFETKVVKVKGEKFGYAGSIYCKDCKKYIKYNFPYHFCMESKGNWVNGENLDKIKFPCFCSYIWGKRKYGILAAGFPIDKREYLLHDIDEQDSCSTVGRNDSLKELIERYDIHILKGKITIYEEE